MKHPTPKPFALLKRIIQSLTNEGDSVFGPFIGSAITGVAAIKLKRKFIGCELETKFLRLSVKRLREAIKASSLTFKSAIRSRHGRQISAALQRG